MFPMPLLPAHSASQTSSTLSPSEVIIPSPVTTTRRLVMRVVSCQLPVASKKAADVSRPTGNWQLVTGNLLGGMFLDVVDGLTHGLDLFGLFVGDRQLELVLELHHEFYG